MDEVWLPVVGFEGFYEVSNLGGVRSLDRTGWHQGRWGQMHMRFPAREMRINADLNGYHYLKLRLPGEKAQHCLVHRLVMAAHFGLPPEGMQVNHKDGEKANNRLDNLEYCTARENLRHCIDVLGKKRGEGTGLAKLRSNQIQTIRNDQRFLREIAADYGVTLQAIHHVKSNKNWAHI